MSVPFKILANPYLPLRKPNSTFTICICISSGAEFGLLCISINFGLGCALPKMLSVQFGACLLILKILSGWFDARLLLSLF